MAYDVKTTADKVDPHRLLICVVLICVTCVWGVWAMKPRYTIAPGGGGGAVAYMVDQSTGETWCLYGDEGKILLERIPSRHR